MAARAVAGSPELERRAPRLAILPHRPRDGVRPGAWFDRGERRGDFHPQGVDFFLLRVRLWRQTSLLGRLVPRWLRSRRAGFTTPISDLQALVQADPATTADYELDWVGVPSGRPARAWATYANELAKDAAAGADFEPCVYAREWVYGDKKRALEYWYFYPFNDSATGHEGDWESAVVELTPEGEPVRVGYSAHNGGAKRAWSRVRQDAGHPVLYVARGSHAGYFRYDRSGWPVIGWAQTNSILRWIAEKIPLLLDWPPAVPGWDSNFPPSHQGLLLTPRIVVIPPGAEHASTTRWWWLRYRGNWGSRKPWLASMRGPIGPAGKPRWGSPLEWLDGLHDA